MPLEIPLTQKDAEVNHWPESKKYVIVSIQERMSEVAYDGDYSLIATHPLPQYDTPFLVKLVKFREIIRYLQAMIDASICRSLLFGHDNCDSKLIGLVCEGERSSRHYLPRAFL